MTVHDSPRAFGYAHARRAGRDWVDAYRLQEKMYPAVCPKCRATEWQGRWRWDEGVPGLAPFLCPACQRIRDGVPAHVLELTGALPKWWTEVKGMIGNVERRETCEHPMERVMKVEVDAERVRVLTTGMHIARQLTAAIVRRFRHGVRLTFATHVTRIEWLPSPP